MDYYISTDEFGRFWVFDGNDVPFNGPYDTFDDAKKDYPEAEWEWEDE